MWIFIIGCLSTVALSVWTKPPKRWIPWALGVLAVACQVWAWIDQDSTQRKLVADVGAARTDLAVANGRTQDLQKKSDLAIALLARTSKNVSDQDLRRQIHETIVSMKLDQISSNTQKPGLGRSQLGGSFQLPEERIASTLERIERGLLQEIDLQMNRGKSPKELILEYYDAVAKIPPFYEKENWSRAEEMIAGDLLSGVQSNLTKRGVYSPERYQQITKVLQDERKRYAEARGRAGGKP